MYSWVNFTNYECKVCYLCLHGFSCIFWLVILVKALKNVNVHGMLVILIVLWHFVPLKEMLLNILVGISPWSKCMSAVRMWRRWRKHWGMLISITRKLGFLAGSLPFNKQDWTILEWMKKIVFFILGIDYIFEVDKWFEHIFFFFNFFFFYDLNILPLLLFMWQHLGRELYVYDWKISSLCFLICLIFTSQNLCSHFPYIFPWYFLCSVSFKTLIIGMP